MSRDRAERNGSQALAALAALFVLFLPRPVAAQYGAPAPQSLPRPPAAAEPAAAPVAVARSELQRAVACLSAREAGVGTALLATAPFSGEERQEAVRTLRAAERCLGSRGRFATSPLLLRGAFAESLYAAQFPNGVAARAPRAAAAASLPAEAASNHQDVAPAFALADCAAGRDAALIRALVATEPGGETESAAMQALNPVFGQCVAPGTSLNIDQAGMRALLAQSLYRWSVVQRDGAASPWAAASSN